MFEKKVNRTPQTGRRCSCIILPHWASLGLQCFARLHYTFSASLVSPVTQCFVGLHRIFNTLLVFTSHATFHWSLLAIQWFTGPHFLERKCFKELLVVFLLIQATSADLCQIGEALQFLLESTTATWFLLLNLTAILTTKSGVT